MATQITMTSSGSIVLQESNNFEESLLFEVSGALANQRYMLYVQKSTDQSTWTNVTGTLITVNSSGYKSLSTKISMDHSLWVNAFQNTSSIYIRGRVVKYDGGDSASSESESAQLIAPPIPINHTITSDWNGNNNLYIKNITTLSATAVFDGQFGASITSVTLYISNDMYDVASASMTLLSGTWNGSILTNDEGIYHIGFRAYDSRGTTTYVKPFTITVKDHTAPAVTAEIFRCDSNGDKDMSGGYLSVTAWATPSPSELSISELYISEIDRDMFPTALHINLDNGVTKIVGSSDLSEDISPDSYYYLDVRAVDNYNLSRTTSTYIPEVQRIINVKDGGTGIAFGKLATKASLMDSKWDINTDGDYFVKGTPFERANENLIVNGRPSKSFDSVWSPYTWSTATSGGSLDSSHYYIGEMYFHFAVANERSQLHKYFIGSNGLVGGFRAEKVKSGDYTTLSFEYQATGDFDITPRLYAHDGTTTLNIWASSNTDPDNTFTLNTASSWTKFVYTSPTEAPYLWDSVINDVVENPTSDKRAAVVLNFIPKTADTTLRIRNVKVNIGKEATSFCESPFELLNNIGARCSYVKGRTLVPLYNGMNTVGNTSNLFPTVGVKSANGSWVEGSIADTYQFTYVTDANYGTGTNVAETFRLPTPNASLSATTNYDIWTTKQIPAPPTTNGTYTLKATVSNGTVTYSWV